MEKRPEANTAERQALSKARLGLVADVFQSGYAMKGKAL
jgi:hypothetical protein